MMLLYRRHFFILLILFTCTKAIAQHYNFINYNSEEGLPQSQVFGLTQSDDRQLWMSTLGGISRFDGKTFYNYTVADGLSASYPLHFVLDRQQRIWALNTSKLNLIENNIIRSFDLPETVVNNRGRLGVSSDNIPWCVLNGKLYAFKNNRFEAGILEGLPNQHLFALLKGHGSDLYLMAARRTLYKYTDGKWKPFAMLNEVDSTDRIRNVHFDSSGDTWIITSRELYVKRENAEIVERILGFPDSTNTLNCITKDNKGNIWIGAFRGAYQVKPDNTVVAMDAHNGFFNSRINDILADVEGNVWFATDGNGLSRFGGGLFTSFREMNNGIPQSVQVVAKYGTNGIVYGNNGNDMCLHENGNKDYFLRNSALSKKDINCLYTDSKGVLWIGSSGAGLWKYAQGKLSNESHLNNSVYSIYQSNQKLYSSTDEGVFILSNGRNTRISSFREFTGTIFDVGRDSILAALGYGLVLIKDTARIEYPFPSNLQSTMITCFEKINNVVIIGTIGGGIFTWNKSSGKFDQITTSNGLPSNIIYALKFDQQQHLWAGTGRGICRISSADNFKTVAIHSYGKEQGLIAPECNKDAITVMPDNKVWFGTIKGLYCYNPEEEHSNILPPVTSIQSIKVFSKPLPETTDSVQTRNTASSSLPDNLSLPSNNNHITIEFRAISYSYANIRYRYYLQGLEKEYSEPVSNDFVVYPSLPPGDYTFHVKAIDEAGVQLGEAATYSFAIVPAFYQTTWFKIALLIGIIGLAFSINTIIKRIKDKQRRMIENLRAEEQRKIRKKTAQDFHDEMGNKLARITVLSDILKTKIPANEETQGLAKKIQDNVAWLYQGTKDIIWSLNPENDNLHYLLKHISDFGVDLFIDTEIEFEPIEMNPVFNEHSLPMDYARNVIMICKEVFTNILKHSQAKKVCAKAEMVAPNKLRLVIGDDGKGFVPQPNSNGNGLTNIKQRAIYLGAELNIASQPLRGTQVQLTFTIPSPESEKNKI